MVLICYKLHSLAAAPEVQKIGDPDSEIAKLQCNNEIRRA
jgi:hypothetical protein